MVIFGLVLLLLAVLVIIAAVVHGGDPASLDLQLFTVKTNVTGVFVAGAITLLILVLGIALVVQGLRHDRSRRAQIKDLKTRASRREGKAPSTAPAPSPTPRPQPRPSTDESRPRSATPSSATSSSSGGSTSGGSTSGGSTSGGSTAAEVSRDEGPDQHFESAPRDPAN